MTRTDRHPDKPAARQDTEPDREPTATWPDCRTALEAWYRAETAAPSRLQPSTPEPEH